MQLSSFVLYVGLFKCFGLSSSQSTSEPQIVEPDWALAYSKAATALTKLNNTAKVGVVTGVGWLSSECVGNTEAVPAIGLPSICLQDGPLGIRFAQGVTAFPAGIQAGATWDRSLMRSRGKAIGEEARALGVHVILGPAAGPLGKIPNGGRNWEGFGADPYLAGMGMIETIGGIQSNGVQACAKHVIGNEQELNRRTMSANIDDRTLHELYMWPFADAIHANVTSVMCSYNRVNGTYACESKAVMAGLVKEGLDFPGFIVSDWDSQRTTEGSANAGLDMSMPGNSFGNFSFYFWGENLLEAVPDEVPQSTLDDMVLRILASWYFMGQDVDYPPTTISMFVQDNPDVQGNHKEVARAVARDGTILLKNDNNSLPLHRPTSIAVIGEDSITNPEGPNACRDRGCNVGTLGMGWGSGTVEYPYLVSPLEAIMLQAQEDGTEVITSSTNALEKGADAAAAAEMAIVCINANSGEAYITVENAIGDRPDLDPWYSGNELVKAVAEVNKKTIVVIHSVGPIILEEILAQENVVAIVWAGLPGQESGNALVDVLYGSTTPSGKLPFTIAKAESDYPAEVVPADDDYDEGLYIDYRYFDKNGIEPRYEFGYGLSYTTFAFSELCISRAPMEMHDSASIGLNETASVPSGPNRDNFATVATVRARITNTGKHSGAEVAQLYVTLPSSVPDSPVRQLRGFAKTSVLEAGDDELVAFDIRRKDLSYWSMEQQRFLTPTCAEFKIAVGASSRDLRLEGVLRL